MERDTLLDLERVNQLSLSEEEARVALRFFAAREAEIATLPDVEALPMTVHVLPTEAVLREDTVHAHFTREQMQAGAPATDAGYFCVPRVLE